MVFSLYAPVSVLPTYTHNEYLLHVNIRAREYNKIKGNQRQSMNSVKTNLHLPHDWKRIYSLYFLLDVFYYAHIYLYICVHIVIILIYKYMACSQ